MSHLASGISDIIRAMTSHITTLKAPSGHLRQLIVIRTLLITALSVGAWLTGMIASYPLAPVSAIILVLVIVNGLSALRLRWPLSVGSQELAAQLLVDILAVAAIAYFTGGATNPFLSYTLVPVCIAAAVLPGIHAWGLSLVAVCLYGLLLIWHEPLNLLAPPAHEHAHHSPGVNLHVLGMWLNFALSTTLISYFVVKMAAAVRQQQDELNARREDDLRDEQLLAVATQAAGTAHELGTPLSTIKVLLTDLAQDAKTRELLGDDLTLLKNQVNECASILQRLRLRADIDQLTRPALVGAKTYCEQLLERWQLLRPEARTLIELDDKLAHRKVRLHPTVEQAIINVLNNAADASVQHLRVRVYCEGSELIWFIADSGAGIPPSTSAVLGKRPITTKPDGLGIGLFLTHASIQRYGGRVKIAPGEQGGTLTTIALPLESNDE